jgi:hypothetical protein
MASVAICRIERVVVVHMAQRAGSRRRRHVCSGQSKSGDAVIERRSSPTGCRVAGRTVCRGKGRTCSGMHGIIRILPIGQMALRVSAIGRRDRQIVVVIDVAQIAGHVGVPVGQREPGRSVIEDSCRPCGDRVAGRARRRGRRESGRNVIRHRAANRRGALKCGRMAPVAIRRIERVVVIYVARFTGS